MFNVAIGIVAQTCLVAAPIFLVIRENGSLATTVAIFAVSAIILKKTWYDRLEDSAQAGDQPDEPQRDEPQTGGARREPAAST
jgi:hypothetical protein